MTQVLKTKINTSNSTQNSCILQYLLYLVGATSCKALWGVIVTGVGEQSRIHLILNTKNRVLMAEIKQPIDYEFCEFLRLCKPKLTSDQNSQIHVIESYQPPKY